MGRARSVPSPGPGEPAPADLVPHPRLRGECLRGPRPCPLVGCLYNNYLEVRRNPGEAPRIKILHPSRLPEDMPPRESCSLDMADSGPHTLKEVADVLGLTRERIRQIEVRALQKVVTAIEKRERSAGQR